MNPKPTALTLLLLGLSSNVESRALLAKRQNITWTACEPELQKLTNLTIQCAELAVPLDYTAPNSSATHTLELLKVPASNGSANSSIIFNHGGPGAEGLKNMINLTPVALKFTGGQYDLISFNPRGTSEKYLRFSCYATDQERLLANTPNPYSLHLDSSDVALGRAWADGKVLSGACGEKMGEAGTLVGTAFTARDAMSIVDALGQGELINYYGMSYGTALGATIAAMFPDRIGKMVLDGVLNPHDYWNSYADLEMVHDADAALAAMLVECVSAGASRCALAYLNMTAPQLETAIYDLFDAVKAAPIPLPPSLVNYTSIVAGSVIDYGSLKTLILATLYHPALFPWMAAGLFQVLVTQKSGRASAPSAADLSVFATWRDVESRIFASAMQGEALLGIRCGDKRLRASSVADLEPTLERAKKTSRLAGLGVIHSFTMPCARWGVSARERYDGDFRVRTRGPVLLIGNTYDPVTPLASARNVSRGFERSVVLERRGFGHVSLTQESACANRIMAEYFSSGKLPASGTVCKPDVAVF